MIDTGALDQLCRYLRQRIELGERIRLLVPGARGAGVGTEATASEAGAGARPAEGASGPGGAASGSGSPAAGVDSLERIVFIGEGPGADEDAQGEPFVGRAGQLLTKIIESVQFRRPDVFITNIVKCRPPNNRDPQPDEIAACEPYLKRQLRLLQPGVICALGRHASMTLLRTNESMGQMRMGERHYAGIRVFPTYHPAALLRNPRWTRPVWEDIQNVRREYDARRKKL
ncbi:MAG: uracil-DNA glycosylase [Candidatus Krumholzibacteriia bacterium]